AGPTGFRAKLRLSEIPNCAILLIEWILGTHGSERSHHNAPDAQKEIEAAAAVPPAGLDRGPGGGAGKLVLSAHAVGLVAATDGGGHVRRRCHLAARLPPTVYTFRQPGSPLGPSHLVPVKFRLQFAFPGRKIAPKPRGECMSLGGPSGVPCRDPNPHITD